MTLRTTRFLGVEMWDHPMEAIARVGVEAVQRGQALTIVPLNPHVFCMAMDEPALAALLTRSLVTIDGQGILLVSRRLRTPLHNRFTGTDLMEAMVAHLASAGKSIFLLGGCCGVAQECADILAVRYPGLKIAGVLEPPLVREAAELPEDEILNAVNRSGADVLFVGLGAPKQETFLHRNRERLRVSVAMTVGGSFDLIAKRKRRAPHWMRRSGMEWLFRVLQEPIRLGPRYAFGIPRFLWCTLVQGRSIQ